MTPPGLEVDRRRRAGEILGDALRLYGRDWRGLLLLAAAVVVPAEVIVEGIGLGWLSGPYRTQIGVGESVVGLALQQLVTVPLVTAMAIAVVLGRDAGRPVSVREALQAGLDRFGALLAAMVLVGVAVALGFALLILPGLFLAVRLALTIPAVVVEGHRAERALERSWRLTRGSWWRTLGTLLAANLAAAAAAAVVLLPLDALAASADAQALSLAGAIIGQVATVPFTALVVLLLFADRRARAAEGAAPPMAA